MENYDLFSSPKICFTGWNWERGWAGLYLWMQQLKASMLSRTGGKKTNGLDSPAHFPLPMHQGKALNNALKKAKGLAGGESSGPCLSSLGSPGWKDPCCLWILPWHTAIISWLPPFSPPEKLWEHRIPVLPQYWIVQFKVCFMLISLISSLYNQSPFSALWT